MVAASMLPLIATSGREHRPLPRIPYARITGTNWKVRTARRAPAPQPPARPAPPSVENIWRHPSITHLTVAGKQARVHRQTGRGPHGPQPRPDGSAWQLTPIVASPWADTLVEADRRRPGSCRRGQPARRPALWARPASRSARDVLPYHQVHPAVDARPASTSERQSPGSPDMGEDSRRDRSMRVRAGPVRRLTPLSSRYDHTWCAALVRE
jgi:hypothetical protein